MTRRDAYRGELWREEQPGERVPVELTCTATGLRAIDATGSMAEIPYRRMILNWSESNDRMLCCRDAKKQVIVYSVDSRFYKALRRNSKWLLTHQFGALESERRKTRWPAYALLTSVFLLVLGVIFGGGPALCWAATIFTPYSVDEEIGKTLFDSMEKGGPVLENEVATHALQRIVDRITPYGEIPEARLRVTIVQNPTINAFALPGGYIVVFTGLIHSAESVDELAGVLAHEAAHVMLRHGLQTIVRSSATVVAISALAGNAGSVANIASQLIAVQTINMYSRETEAEADEEAVRMLMDARIQPDGFCTFLEGLAELEEDCGESYTWMSSHPASSDRVTSIRKQVKAAGKRKYRDFDIDLDDIKDEIGPPVLFNPFGAY